MNSTFEESDPFSNGTLLMKLLNEDFPDFVSSVPEHWLAQEAPSRMAQYILLTVYLILVVPANICQFLIIFVFLR
jgi:hypothetical protein